MMKFAGKNVLITGAAGGIGQAIVKCFKGQGATVAVNDLDTTKIEADRFYNGDLTDPNFVESLIPSVIEDLGSIDILCNNAGIITRGDITTASDADYARSMAINVEAPFRLCRAVIPHMAKNGGGAIVNTSSCWGVHPGPNHPIYVMSKAAVASLTQCLGRDHAHQNIRVNAVCPNEVNTPMIRTGFEIRGLDAKEGIAELGKSVPLGRVAEPEDIADVVGFLASDEARYICGALLEVNGGKPVS